MRTIWKYALPIVDEQVFLMPAGAELLSLQMQDRNACVWALVETTNMMARQILRFVGTGQPVLPHIGRYVGTIQEASNLVWHLFHEQPDGL